MRGGEWLVLRGAEGGQGARARWGITVFNFQAMRRFRGEKSMEWPLLCKSAGLTPKGYFRWVLNHWANWTMSFSMPGQPWSLPGSRMSLKVAPDSRAFFSKISA